MNIFFLIVLLQGGGTYTPVVIDRTLDAETCAMMAREVQRRHNEVAFCAVEQLDNSEVAL